jgi:hypothetical protein
MAPRARLAAHLLLSCVSVVVLVGLRPGLDATTLARGDELAAATAWLVTLGASAWIACTTATCLAAIWCSRPALARQAARHTLPGVRRIVEVAVAGSCIALPALPAAATPMPSPPSYGVFVRDEPVVRAPAPTTIPRLDKHQTPTTRVPLRVTPSVSAPHADQPPPDRPTEHVHMQRPRPVPARAYVVQSGDNLWRIARVTLADADHRLTDLDVARYWRAVIEANRSTLRSGDPSLIYPGEIVSLPPVK